MDKPEKPFPPRLQERYQWIKDHAAPDDHPGFGLEVIASDRRALIADITAAISNLESSLEYTRSWKEYDGLIHIHILVDTRNHEKEIKDSILSLPSVQSIHPRPSQFSTYGKRIIVIGGGAQVAQVASGAVVEADRHNIRGEKISVDTVAVVGEDRIADTISATATLDRASLIVLAGALMGGKVTRAVKEIRQDYGIPVLALNMAGSVTREADLVITDPTEAGVMAVMLISRVGQFNLLKMDSRRY